MTHQSDEWSQEVVKCDLELIQFKSEFLRSWAAFARRQAREMREQAQTTRFFAQRLREQAGWIQTEAQAPDSEPEKNRKTIPQQEGSQAD